MDIVFGSGPLAEALAAHLGRSGEALLAGPAAGEGRFLWRRADLRTGEGVLDALRPAERAFFVLPAGEEAHGAFAVLERLDRPAGVIAVPLGAPVPVAAARLPRWARVEVGPCWGAAEPLVARWSAQVAAGAHVWVPDPGPVHAVPMPDAVLALAAAAAVPEARWRVTSPHPSRLPDLVEVLGVFHDRPVRATRMPLGWSMRRIGVAPAAVRAWLQVPALAPETPGWDPPPSVGAEGWTAGLTREL